MTCDEIDRAIRKVFDEIRARAGTGNITDDMVINSDFNRLKELAKSQCNRHYSIDWTDHGYVLGVS